MNIFDALEFFKKFKFKTYFKELSKRAKMSFVFGNIMVFVLLFVIFNCFSISSIGYGFAIVVLFLIPDCYILGKLPKEKVTFEINVIKDESSDNTVAKYRIFLKNKSSEVKFDRIQVTYQYYHGILCALDTPYIPEHLSYISIILPVDVHNQHKRTKVRKLPSPIIFPEDSKEVEIEVDLVVDLGEKGYHPCFDWNITCSVALITTDERKLLVLNDRKWREIEL